MSLITTVQLMPSIKKRCFYKQQQTITTKSSILFVNNKIIKIQIDYITSK